MNVGLLANLSLFSGAGGLDLGARITGGFRTARYATSAGENQRDCRSSLVTPRVTREEFAALRRKADERKKKRKEKRAQLWPSRPRAKKGPSLRQRLVKILDNLWSVAVRLRGKALYGPMCQICAERPAEVGYHLVPKQRGYAIRWLLEAGIAACSPCNLGEMMNRSLYREKHIKIFGLELIEGLEAIAAKKVHFSIPDLRDTATSLRLKIKEKPWARRTDGLGDRV